METDKQGRHNWVFAGRAKPAAATSTSGDATTVNLDGVLLSDSRITYRVGLTQLTRTIDIKSLQIVNQGEQTVLSAQFAGQRQQWKLDGKTGRYEALMRGEANWPFEAQLTADGAKLAARGSVDAAGTLRADVTVRIERAAALVPLLADAAALPMPIEASAKVQRSAVAVTADDVHLSVGTQSLNGRVKVRTDQAVPQIELDVTAASIDLSQWAIKKPATAPTPTAAGPVFTDAPLPVITLPNPAARQRAPRSPGRAGLAAVVGRQGRHPGRARATRRRTAFTDCGRRPRCKPVSTLACAVASHCA